MNDIVRYRFQREAEEAVERRPHFLSEVLPAEVGYTFGRVYDNAKAVYQNQDKIDPDFNWRDHIKGWEQHAPYLSKAFNAEMMASMKLSIEEDMKRRQTLSDATLGQSLGAGFLNPVNFIALPVGVGRTVLGGAWRGATSVAALEAGLEVVRQSSSSLQTYEEGASNILMSSLFGGAFGAVSGGFRAARNKAHVATQERLNDFFSRLSEVDKVSALSSEEIDAPIPQERQYKEASEDDLNARITELEAEASRLEQETGPENLDLQERAEELKGQASSLRKELSYRYLEEVRKFGDDPYSIIANKFTDSVLFKMISTPMKRALQSKYPTSVKERFVRLAHDSGVTLALNAIGKAAPPSTYMKTAVSLGEVIREHDSLIRIWARETNASEASRLDLNFEDIKRKVTFSDDTFSKWLERTNRKRIAGEKNLTDGEAEAINRINEYFRAKGELLESVGLIRSQKGLSVQIEALRQEVAVLEGRLTRHDSSSRIGSLISRRLSDVKKSLKDAEEAYQASSIVENPEDFYPRFWNHGKIKANRQELSDILVKWFSDHPYVMEGRNGEWVKVELSTAPDDLRARAENAIDTILGESDPTNIDTIGVGYGRSKHFRHRTLDVPNALVMDFIETNPLAAIKTYAARIEPRYWFQKDFGKDFRGALFDLEYDMLEAGGSEADVNAARRDFVGLYEQIAGTVVKNPDAISQKVAYFLREMASFTYMGGAGLASIPDFGRIVMQHEMGTVFKSVTNLLDRSNVDKSVDEVRLSGAITEIVLNSSHMRMMEDMGNSVESNALLNSARNAFYILNGLAPLTAMAKQVAGLADAHTIIDYSIKLSQGKLDDQGRTWLARHGVDEEYAQLIARAPWEKSQDGLYMANTDAWADSIYIPEIEGKRITVIEQNEDGSPVGKSRKGRYIPAYYRDKQKTIYFDRDYIEGSMFEEKAWLDPKMKGVNALPDIFKTPKQWANFVMLHEINHTRFSREDLGFTKDQTAEYENAINDLALKDYREAQTINEDAVLRFRSALNSGVLNQIMTATPADKPLIVKGIAYIPMSIASKFGMKEDATVRGYARVENGLLGLPFQFYNFLLASVNKTVAAFAHGQVKNRMLGSAAMLGLGYIVTASRTPSYVWDEMEVQDKMARSIDMSGLLGIYSDLFYTTLHTVNEMGGPNITNGFISPKYQMEPSVIGAVSGLAGAGPSWALDTASAIGTFLSGDFGEGAKDFVRNLPASNLWFIRDDVNQITRGWAN